MDVLRKLQLSPTQHEEAKTNFHALADYVDGEGSELQGHVIRVSPSGSFAIGAPILGKVSSQQYDVDAVIELDLPEGSHPQDVLEKLYRSIKRDRGSRYYSKTELHSRCVTVTYDDGHTFDLMPVVRVARTPERVVNLFHYKASPFECYCKDVNPKGFSTHFREKVPLSTSFTKLYDGYRSIVASAETEEFPPYEALDQMSPRVGALQLNKRSRDMAYRNRPGKRPPPSIISAALALNAPSMLDSLTLETISVATHIRETIRTASRSGNLIDVRNPKWEPDKFTDRWPKSIKDQDQFASDLTRMIKGLTALSTQDLSPSEQQENLVELFGETAAQHAVDEYFKRYGKARQNGRTEVKAAGNVGMLAASAPPIIKRPFHGGICDDDS